MTGQTTGDFTGGETIDCSGIQQFAQQHPSWVPVLQRLLNADMLQKAYRQYGDNPPASVADILKVAGTGARSGT